MSKGTIKSNTIAAEGAINELVGIKTYDMDNKQVEVMDTVGISGMIAGMETANQMLECMSHFISVILGQANKFPALAAKIEKRDIEDGQRWDGT